MITIWIIVTAKLHWISFFFQYEKKKKNVGSWNLPNQLYTAISHSPWLIKTNNSHVSRQPENILLHSTINYFFSGDSFSEPSNSEKSLAS